MQNLLMETTNKATIDSREVAEMMGKEHKEILQYIEGRQDKNGESLVTGIIPTLESEGIHSSNYFIESSYKSGTREYKCYLVTKMGCELLGNKQQGAKGILFTAKYVESFNAMEEALVSSEPAYRIPQNYKEALLAIIESEEQKEKLALENSILTEKIKEDKHKVDFYSMAKDSTGLISVRDAAKIINIKGIGQRKLFEILRDSKILCKDNLPYQQYINRGYFIVKESCWTNPNTGDTNISMSTKVTQIGLHYINNIVRSYINK